MGKKKNLKIGFRIIALLLVVIAIFAGGYVFLDKMIVPKYFGQYGIGGVPDLVGVVTSLYKSPKESKFVTNGFTQNDLSHAITKLQDANYTIKDDGTIDEDHLIDGNETELILTDRELAAICDQMLENGILIDVLPDLNYLNITKISILQLIIVPTDNNDQENTEDEAVEDETKTFESANISFIARIETTDIREQIAIQMNTPKFLLNMIIPDNLYFEVSYDIDLSKESEGRITNGNIAINGRTVKQSDILINLLVSFIFPEEDNMDKEKFTSVFGDIILRGIDMLGSFSFIENIGNGKQYGIIVNRGIH